MIPDTPLTLLSNAHSYGLLTAWQTVENGYRVWVGRTPRFVRDSEVGRFVEGLR